MTEEEKKLRREKLVLLLQAKRQEPGKSGRKHTVAHNKPQLLDYYLAKELKDGVLPRGYSKRVLKNLAENHEISLQGRHVYQRVTRVFAGDTLRPSSDINGTPSDREGKEKNYAGVFSLMDVNLPKRNELAYIGLPSNQLDVIAARVGGLVVAVEKKPKKAQELEQLNKLVKQRRPSQEGEVKVLCDNIFNVMQSWKGRDFNFIDLDLMCNMPRDPLPWVKAIYHCAARGNVLVHVTTCIGRTISEKEYETNLNTFNNCLDSVGFTIVGKPSRYGYWDRIIPMRCERYILQRREQ